MINTIDIQATVDNYIEQCNKQGIHPTYKGLGIELGIATTTVRHIVTGIYKDGKPYTNKPHPTRCIANDDFKIIQDIYM